MTRPQGRDAAGSLQARVVSTLGADIATGALSAGDLLAPEEVGRRFGVSRTIVREAFRALEARGMITARPRLGTTVTPRAAWNLIDPQVISWRGRGPEAGEQLRDLLVLREAVEPAAAALAALRADEGRIRGISASAELLASAAADRDEAGFVAADTLFHRELVEASASPVLIQLLGTIEAALQRRYTSGPALFTAATAVSLTRHRALADAIAAHDADRARAESSALVREARAEVEGTEP